jgi:hypothetical protein
MTTLDLHTIGLIVAGLLALLGLFFRDRPAAGATLVLLLKGLPVSSSFNVGTVLGISVNWTDASGNATDAPSTPPTFAVSDAAVLGLDTTQSVPTLTTLKPGTATLSMTDGTITASLSITVTAGPATGGTIVLTPISPS